jgi:23S rRNA pseudouridine1911/1915/1917 synthase
LRKNFQIENAIMDLESSILYEDNHLLAVNKPAGILVQKDQTGDLSLVDYAKEYLRVRYNKPGEAYVGLVHRLDRPVSGVTLLTKTSKALTRMNKEFADGKVIKCYWALTPQIPPSEQGKLINWLRKDPARNRTRVFKKEGKGAKRSELQYELKLTINGKHLLEVYPRTGRPHQIRAQLGAIGCPIIGDVKYGFQGKHSQTIALHARSLQFNHPVKKEPLLIEAPLPIANYWQPFQN